MGRRRTYALLLWLLAVLFALRVLGQGVPSWTPVPWLPSFESFQGSGGEENARAFEVFAHVFLATKAL